MNLRKTVDELNPKYQTRRVVLVDLEDNEIGEAGLIEAHRDPGMKHRAFSLVLYRRIDDKFEILLQQRSAEKPVFPLFWTNTCCYNLVKGEGYLTRAVSRVKEEMGIEIPVESLRQLYKFSYYAPDIEGWCENELDTVIVGQWDGEIHINPEEVAEYKWMQVSELERDIQINPEIYSLWFKMILADPRFRTVFE
ncbi:isopentenyl-diphosphate Delta-isomerase [Candidatus Woesebacteria bacterium]|nr:isopentenyl-diphosphate Delta-isomerase [Candidatus Woesebacteria bacterium]